MMTFRPYTVGNLQLQLKESHRRHRIECRFVHDSEHVIIIDELGRLGRWDIVDLEKRRDNLARLGYDADQVIADVMAGRDPLAAETELQRRRELVSNERLALLRLGIMRKHNDGIWCRPELNEAHPARCERRREIKFKVGALRARRAVERVIKRGTWQFILYQVSILTDICQRLCLVDEEANQCRIK